MLYKILDIVYRLAGSLVMLCGKIAAGLTIVLVFVTVTDVLLRYFFNAGSLMVQELEWHIFSAIFLLGSAYTLQKESHVRVDIIYSKLPSRGKALIDIFGTLVFLVPLCLVAISVGIPFVERSFALNEGSPDPGGLPMRYIPKAFIVIGFSLLLLEGFGFFLRSVTKLILGHDAEYFRRRNA